MIPLFKCVAGASVAWASVMFLVSARAEPSVSVNVPAVRIGQRAVASIAVDFAAGIAGGDLSLRFPAFVQAEAAQTELVTAGFQIASRTEAGRIAIALAGPKGLADQNVVLVQVPLQIAPSAPAGSVELVLERVQLYDDQPKPVSAQVLAGSMTILPSPADSDKDGLPDEWEQLHFGNMSSAPGKDSDGDGLNDDQEYVAGTDPAAAKSTFRILQVGVSEQAGERRPWLEWESVEGRAYDVEWSDGPVGGAMVWHQVYNPALHQNGTRFTWTDDGTRTYSVPRPDQVRYYRVMVRGQVQ